MRFRRIALLVVCALLVGAAVPAAAGAAFGNYKGESADAWWSSWDWETGEPSSDDPIAEKGLSGYKNSSIWKDGKASAETLKETSGGVWMYSYVPASDGEPRVWTQFSCFSLDPAFVVGRKLSSASLEFMAPALTEVWVGDEPWVEDGEDFYMRDPDQVIDHGMVSVMADWTPAGPVSRSMYISRERSEEFTYMDRSQQMYRDAHASVSVVGADGPLWVDDIPGSIYESKGVNRFPF